MLGESVSGKCDMHWLPHDVMRDAGGKCMLIWVPQATMCLRQGVCTAKAPTECLNEYVSRNELQYAHVLHSLTDIPNSLSANCFVGM